MKWRKLSIILMLAAAALGVANSSWAHGRARVGVGVYVGGPFWPWYSPYPPFYAYPSVIAVPVAPAQPPVYIEQHSETPPQNYWYYCNSSKTYYPYVQECPEGWQKVVPQPPQQ